MKRRHHKRKGSKFILPLVLTLFVFVAVAFSARPLWDAAQRLHQDWQVEYVEAVVHNHHNNVAVNQHLYEISQTFINQPMLSVSQAKVAQAFAHVEDIQHVSISRKLPKALQITLTMHQPFMRLANRDGYLVSQRGYVYRPYKVTNEALPMLQANVHLNWQQQFDRVNDFVHAFNQHAPEWWKHVKQVSIDASLYVHTTTHDQRHVQWGQYFDPQHFVRLHEVLQRYPNLRKFNVSFDHKAYVML